MGFLFLLILLIVFVVLPRLFGKRVSGDARTRLMTSGLPARGLVVRAASTGRAMMLNGQRFQVRNVLLDVEVQGRAPYEIGLDALFPRMCESFPGTALDLRVDPANPANVAIVGPAGSSAWIGAASWLGPQTGLAAQTSSGCGWVVIAVIGLFLAGGAVVSFVGGAGSSEITKPEETPAPTHAAPTHAPTHAVTETPSAPHPDCEAAARCCKALGRTRCVFTSSSEAACRAALDEEKRAAAKVGKTCK